MLPKTSRITRKEFPVLSKGQGIRVFSGFFSGTLYPLEAKKVQVAVVVSKKVSKRAVVRNELKRKVYNAMRDILPLFPKGYAVVFYPKLEMKEVSLEDLTSEIKTSLASKGIL